MAEKPQEPSFWEMMDSFVLLAHAILAASQTLFLTITSLFELYLKFKEFILLIQMQKNISKIYSSITNS